MSEMEKKKKNVWKGRKVTDLLTYSEMGTLLAKKDKELIVVLDQKGKRKVRDAFKQAYTPDCEEVKLFIDKQLSNETLTKLKGPCPFESTLFQSFGGQVSSEKNVWNHDDKLRIMRTLLESLAPTHLRQDTERLCREDWKIAEKADVEKSFWERFQGVDVEDIMTRRKDDEDFCPDGMFSIYQAMTEERNTILSKIKDMQNQMVSMSSKKSRITSLSKELRMQDFSERDRTVVKTIASSLAHCAKQASDGYSTYAEPTKELVEKLALAMKKLGIGDSDKIAELGCGVGTVGAIFAQYLKVSVLGIELSVNRLHAMAPRMIALLKKFGNDVAFSQFMPFYGDIEDVETIDATVYYNNDEAFPPGLMEHVVGMFCRSTAKFLFSTKEAKFPGEYTVFFKDHGLYKILSPITGNKIGSNESAIFNVYAKSWFDYSPLTGKGIVVKPPVPMPRHTTNKYNYTPFATKMQRRHETHCTGSLEQKIKTFEDLMRETTIIMDRKRIKKKHRADATHCRNAVKLQRCNNVACVDCALTFTHLESSNLVEKSVTRLGAGQKGLFIKKGVNIRGGQLVLRLRGKKNKAPVRGREKHTFRVGGGFIDTGDRELSRLVNHACQPNCGITTWRDHTGSSHTSFFALNDFGGEEEITVDYGKVLRDFVCRCPNCVTLPFSNSEAVQHGADVPSAPLRELIPGGGKMVDIHILIEGRMSKVGITKQQTARKKRKTYTLPMSLGSSSG